MAQNSMCDFLAHGHHELQLSENGEADLQKHFNSCTKNPGHNNFIPLHEFSMQHLPKEHRDKEMYELCLVLSGLTARIGGINISPNRPKVWPKTDKPYPLSDNQSGNAPRNGTGRISDVHRYSKSKKHSLYDHCPCDYCAQVNEPSTSWRELEIYTAAHVIFDETEAMQSVCRFFYDSPDSPVVSLKVFRFALTDVEKDFCMITCITCDPELMYKLDDLRSRYYGLWRKMYENHRASRLFDKLTIIVSHPHGCSKHISFGFWIERQQEGEYESKYMYTTPTCPGSSGASVYRLGFSGRWFFDRHVHSGTVDAKINYSSIGWDDNDELL